MFLRQTFTSSSTLSQLASTKAPIFPFPWIYEAMHPSDTTFLNLLMFKFSPITAIFSFNASLTDFPASFNQPSDKNFSTSSVSVSIAWSATSLTKFWKSSFLATRSVSEFTSTILAVLPSSLTLIFTAPSAAILPAFLLAAASPFSLKYTMAFSMSPAVSTNAFLQSIMPTPVFSLSSLISLVVIAIIISPYIFIR